MFISFFTHQYSQIGANGYRFIKSTDLITKYFGLLSTAQHDQNTVELLAGIIDTSKDGYISFSEFVTFEGLLTGSQHKHYYTEISAMAKIRIKFDQLCPFSTGCPLFHCISTL